MAWWGGRSIWPTPPERTRSWPDAISSASWSCACRRIINDNRGASALLQEARNMNIVRLYTGKDGQTHIEELDPTTHPELTTLQPTKGIVFRTTKPGHFSDWHNAPRRQFVITLAGEVEIGLGDGTRRVSSAASRACPSRFLSRTEEDDPWDRSSGSASPTTRRCRTRAT